MQQKYPGAGRTKCHVFMALSSAHISWDYVLYLIGNFWPIGVRTGDNGYKAQEQQQPHGSIDNEGTTTTIRSRDGLSEWTTM